MSRYKLVTIVSPLGERLEVALLLERAERFAVQSVNWIYADDTLDGVQQMLAEAARTLMDANPELECSWFDTADEALSAHHHAFSQ